MRAPDECPKGAQSAYTIRLFRERLAAAGAIRSLFEEFDAQLRRARYLTMGGRIVDALLVAAPRQRNTLEEKAAIKAGKTAGEIGQRQTIR